MSASLLAFFIALFASLVLAVPVRALALRVGMVDLPGPRKVHLQPIPLLGGLAIYGGVLLGVHSLFQGEARAQIGGILAGATLIAAVGILDDRGWLHHQVKLFIGMPLAAGILLLSGIHAQVFSVLVGGRIGEVLDALLSVVWVVGITDGVVQHSGSHGRLVRRNCRDGFDVFCNACVSEWLNARVGAGRGGIRGSSGISAVEF